MNKEERLVCFAKHIKPLLETREKLTLPMTASEATIKITTGNICCLFNYIAETSEFIHDRLDAIEKKIGASK